MMRIDPCLDFKKNVTIFLKISVGTLMKLWSCFGPVSQDLIMFYLIDLYFVFVGPPTSAGRVLYNRVCPSVLPSILPSVYPSARKFSGN